MSSHAGPIDRQQQERAMSQSFLRRVLLADAAVSGATGVLMIAAAGPLENLLGLG